jgi:hypothetical protein
MTLTLDLELEVEYTFFRGYPDTREEPGEPPSIEISSVKYNGLEILPAFKEQDYDRLLELCWEDYEYERIGND